MIVESKYSIGDTVLTKDGLANVICIMFVVGKNSEESEEIEKTIAYDLMAHDNKGYFYFGRWKEEDILKKVN